MLSLKDFNQLELACRIGRSKLDNDLLFGGIQVVACGDFFQLPPVPNRKYGDKGEYCFQSSIWMRAFPHIVTLMKVNRQSENELITAIRQCAVGAVTDETHAFLSSLSRPLRGMNEADVVHLYATNYDCELYNSSRLDQHPGPSVVYASQDDGSARQLDRLQCRSFLRLKVGVPVMLLRNISSHLVNGLRGKITALRDNNVDVYFESLAQQHTIAPVVFSCYDPALRRNIASRRQLPLRLCYGITIHKAQGLTLTSMRVFCAGIRSPGQLSVAIGRAVTVAGLQIIGYNRGLIKNHPQCVYDAASKDSQKPLSERTCCTQYHIPDFKSDESFDMECSGEDSSSSTEIYTERVEPSTTHELESDSSVADADPVPSLSFNDACQSLLIPPADVITHEQEQRNIIIQSINSYPHGHTWFLQLKEQLMKMIKSIQPEFPVCSGNWNDCMATLYSYVSGTDFAQSLPFLYESSEYQEITDDHRHIAVDLVFKCFNSIFQASSSTPEQQTTFHTPVKQIPAAGRGKIRDVAGMCVARSRRKYMSIVAHNIYRESAEAFEAMRNASHKVSLLRAMEIEESQTNDQGSLQAIQKKQQHNTEVTIVNDSSFEFFTLLTYMLDSQLTLKNLSRQKEHILQLTLSRLEENQQVKDAWTKVCPNTNDDSWRLFHELTSRFVKVFGKQFRKDALRDIRVSRKKAFPQDLTSKLQPSSNKEDGGNPTNVDLHSLIQKSVRTNGSIFSNKNILKNDVLDICKAYNVTVKKSFSKQILNDLLVQSILSASSISHPNFIPDSFKARVHTPLVPGKGKGKGRKRKAPGEVVNYYCVICGQLYIEDVLDWIRCDKCEGWLDRTCAQLVEEDDWEEASVPDNVFYCAKCKTKMTTP